MDRRQWIFGTVLAWFGLSGADEPDPQTVLNEAQALTRQGKFEEALQKFVWFHENALRIAPAMSGVRLSFALSYWIKLGELYPKARETLVAIRDKDLTSFKLGLGTTQLFRDIAAINGYLDESPKTIALFKTIDVEKPELAQPCYFFVESTLAEAHEYKLCGQYIPDASERFQSTISGYKLMRSFEARQPANANLPIPKTAGPMFVKNTRQMIEILVNVDRRADAETIRNEALAVLDDPGIRSAIEDAEKTRKPE